ncbi:MULTISPECIES: ABC transporter ATP-binding protein [unclassified Streptomyces]|uniref:ABC transporter ATP-binding protein n=1 Tax=unclassified Streptomyces TaxID=2593676 RepID=UPI003821863A
MTALDVQHLARRFRTRRGKEVVALDDVSLSAERGEVVGLLGPNGAGKTTLSRILTTLLVPSSGTARVLGFDVVADPEPVRRRTGLVLGGERGLYSRLTARQNLRYWAALQGLASSDARRRTEELIARMGLAERADDRLETFSRGMIQRVHLARALLHRPELIVLDEPTAGMDPNAAAGFRTMVRELRSTGVTILLATHDMAEAQALCTRVALIDRGRLLRIGAPEALLTELGRYHVITAVGVDVTTAGHVRALPGVRRAEHDAEGSLRVEAAGAGTPTKVMGLLARSPASHVTMTAPSLSDVYRSVIEDRELAV